MTTATASTTERYVQFVTMVATSPELSRQLETTNDSDGIVRLAAANGYSFTADELKSAAHETRARLDASESELSEQDLEAVAGGFPGLGTIVHAIRKAVDWVDDKLNGKAKK